MPIIYKRCTACQGCGLVPGKPNNCPISHCGRPCYLCEGTWKNGMVKICVECDGTGEHVSRVLTPKNILVTE